MLKTRLASALLAGGICWVGQGQGRAAGFASGLYAEFYGLKRFTTEDGLPQNTIRCLLQSREGYLWVGTSAGVARYDGVKFTCYISELLTADGGDARVMDLVEDGQYRIWVRTEETMACFYHGRWDQYSRRASPLNGMIQTCCASREGGVWLAMLDGVKFFQNGLVTRVLTEKDGLRARTPDRICEDSGGNLWLGFGPEFSALRWQRWNSETGAVEELGSLSPPNGIDASDLVEDPAGAMWACGPREFARLFRGQVTRYPYPGIVNGRRLSHLACDDQGTLWFVCDGSRQVFSFRDGRAAAMAAPDLPSKDLRSLLVDREGLVWVGTGDAGLIQIRPRQFIPVLTTNLLGEKIEVFSIVTGQGGRVWFGSSDGLFRLEEGVLTQFTNNTANAHGRYENSIRSVLEDREGKVWFGVLDEGLRTLESSQFVPVPGAACGSTNPWTVFALAQDARGTIWIGSDNGLVRRTPAGEFGRIPEQPALATQPITGLQAAEDGSVWVGTLGTGVYQVRNGTVRHLTTREGLANDSATPLLVETNGTAWIATSAGLNRVRGNAVRKVSAVQGLFDNRLYSLIYDLRGSYWASCNRGVFLMSEAELNGVADGLSNRVNCVVFGEADGMPSAECNGECQPNTVRAADGTLWFSTTHGSCVIDSGNPWPAQVAPQAVIEEVVADDEILFKEGSPTAAGREHAAGARLRLRAGHARVLEIRYTATSFRRPGGLQFQHRLIGLDREWREAATRRAALYTNLRPGEYEFEVKACTDQGVYSLRPAVFAFTITPHLWQTWQFLAVSAATLAGLGMALQVYRLRWQQRLRKLEQQRALANERTRIARDLHDDLGTALTGLALELDVAVREAGSGAAVAGRLGQTAGRARDLAERMREVVWTINPRCDTVLSLATFLEQQAGQFLSSDGLRVRLNFPAEIPVAPLGAEARHQLALSFREALNNVVRHARATEVNVNLQLEPDSLQIEIVDNGCGFRMNDTKGNGLTNMRGRMHQIGGSCDYLSAPGRGTTVRFKIPFAAGKHS